MLRDARLLRNAGVIGLGGFVRLASRVTPGDLGDKNGDEAGEFLFGDLGGVVGILGESTGDETVGRARWVIVGDERGGAWRRGCGFAGGAAFCGRDASGDATGDDDDNSDEFEIIGSEPDSGLDDGGQATFFAAGLGDKDSVVEEDEDLGYKGGVVAAFGILLALFERTREFLARGGRSGFTFSPSSA